MMTFPIATYDELAAQCISDMKSVAQTGKYTLEAQVRAYDLLDAILAEDPSARVACETTVTTGQVLVMGEISTKCYIDIQKIVRNTVREIGYDRAKYGFDCDTCAVISSIHEQSPDIAMGVDKALEAYPAIKVSDAQAKRFRNGGELDSSRIRTALTPSLYRVYSPSDEFLGLGEFRENETNLFVKRVFVND